MKALFVINPRAGRGTGLKVWQRLERLVAKDQGCDAVLSRSAAHAGRLPTGLGGKLPYLLGALSTLMWFRPVQVEVLVDDQRYSGPAMMVAVANGSGYGGGMQIAPRARNDDGELDVCIAGCFTPAHLDGEPLAWESLDFQALPGALAVALPSVFTLPDAEEDWADLPDTRAGAPDSVLWWDF